MRFVIAALGASLAALALQGDGIIRLKPSDFRQLPSAVRRDLDKRGCRIPQVPGKAAPHNVISGSFTSAGSRDWAVLCSVKGASRILIYRNGGPSKIDSLGRQADSVFMQVASNGVTEFSRKIDLAGPRTLADRAKARRGPKPPPLDHDGVEDGVDEKGSTIRYHHRGKWVELQGGD